jgi:TP901 family phage tail tape measure protein
MIKDFIVRILGENKQVIKTAKDAEKYINQVAENIENNRIGLNFDLNFADLSDDIIDGIRNVVGGDKTLEKQLQHLIFSALYKNIDSEINDIASVLGKAFDEANIAGKNPLTNYVQTGIDEINQGFKDGIDESVLFEKFKHLKNISNSFSEEYGKDLGNNVADKLEDIQDKFKKSLQKSYTENYDYFTELENKKNKLETNKDSVSEILKKLSNDGKGIDNTISKTAETVSKSLATVDEGIGETSESLESISKVRIFDGLHEEIYDAEKDFDSLVAKITELAEKMEFPNWHLGDISDSVVKSSEYVIPDNMGDMIGENISLGSGLYFTQMLNDLLDGNWGGTLGGGGNGKPKRLYMTDLGKVQNMYNAISTGELTRLNDLSATINQLVFSRNFRNIDQVTGYNNLSLEEQIEHVYTDYSNIMNRLKVTREEFSEFITNKQNELDSILDKTDTLETARNKLRNRESFSTDFFKQLGLNGISAGYAGNPGDSTMLGSVVYDWLNNLKNTPIVDFGLINDSKKNEELAKSVYRAVFEKILRKKAENPKNIIESLMVDFTPEDDPYPQDITKTELYKILTDIQTKSSQKTFDHKSINKDLKLKSLSESVEVPEIEEAIENINVAKTKVQVAQKEAENVKDETSDFINDFKKFIDAIADVGNGVEGIESIASTVDGQHLLERLGFLKEGKITAKEITDGYSNRGGFVGDDYTLIARDLEYEAKTQSLIPALDKAAEAGANVARIVGTIKDEANGLVYEIQETAKGEIIGQDNLDFLDATDEQIKKLISDIKILSDSGLFVDVNGDNVLYDKANGFSFIDLATRSSDYTTNDPSEIKEYIGSYLSKNQMDSFLGRIESLENTDIVSSARQVSEQEAEFYKQLEQKQNALSEAQRFLQEADKDIDGVSQTSTGTTESLERGDKDFLSASQQISQRESELLEKVQAKEKELADANAKLDESTGLYDDAVQQIHQLQDENRGLADESDTFLGKVEELQEQLEAADERIRENHKFYDEQLGKLQETVDTLTHDNNQLIEDNQYWQSESARKQSVIDALKANNKDVKEQSTANAFSEQKSDGKISNNESEVFNSIEKAALDAAVAKELFTEDNQKLMAQVGYSVARLESETKAFKDLAEAGLDAAAAKELVTEENVNLGAIIEDVLPNIKAEAEAFDKMGGYDGSKTSSSEKSGGKRKRGVTQTDKKNLNKLKETINGSEYLSSIYGSDIEDLENRFANFDKAKDSIDELRDSLSKLKQQVSETAKEQNDAGAQFEKTANSAKELYDRINAAQNKNNYSDEYNQHLEDLKTSLQEIIDAEKNHDASEAWDTKQLDEYKNVLDGIKQELKSGKLSNADNIMASTGQVDKLLNKVKSDMAGSSLSGSLLADYEKLRSVLEDVRVGEEGTAKGVSSITKKQLQDFINEWIRLNGEIKDSGQNIKSFQHQFSSALTNQAAQFLAQYFSFRDIIRYGRELAQTVTQTNSALTELKKVSDASNTRIQQSFSRSSETAQELGSTITDVINSTADWARLGYSIDQAEDLARVTQLYQTVGDNMTQETASQSLVSMLQGFQIDASQAERVVDSVNEVANNFAIDTAGIGEALQRSAAAFNASGTDLNKSIALVTTANAVLQNPESVGTIFKTMSARIRGAKTELADLGEEEDEFTQTTSKLRDLIKQLTGFDIMEDENTYKDIYEILLGIGKEWKTLTDIEQASLAESLAGKRGANALFAVLNNTQQLEKAYKSAQGAAGSAAREQENYAQSVQYSIDRARASLEELANDFLSSELLKGLIETANTFLQIVDKIVETLGSGTSIVTAFLGIDAAKGFLGNQGLIANLIKGITDYKTGGTADSILGNLLRINKSTAVAIGKEAGEAVANGAAVAVGSAAPKVGGILGSGILSGLGPVLAGGAIALLIGGAIYAAYKNYKEDLIKGAKASAEDWNSASISLKDYGDQLTDLRAQLDSENLSESERYQIKQEIYSIQQKITDEYGSQARGVDLINGDLNKQLQILDQISEKEARTNLRENKKEYKEVAKRFEKNYDDIKLQIAPQITDDGTREFAEEMERAMRETGIVKDFYRDIDTGSNIVVEGGDISKLAENADILTKKLYEIKAGYEEIGDVAKASYVESVINEVSAQTGKISDSYKDLADTYNHYVEMQILSKGGRGVLDAASDAVDKYNEALTSGKSEEIDSLRATMQGAINDLNTFANNNGIKIGLAEVGSQVDEVEEKIFNVKNALSENPSNTNPYIDEVTILKKSFDELKDYDFDDIDLLNLINNPTAFDGNLRKMSGELLYMQNALGLSDEELIKIAQDLGAIKTVAADVGDSISTEFNNFKKSIGSTLTTLDSVNAALASAAGGKGLSLSVNEETGALEGDLITIKNAFADLEGFNPADLFRKTANGVKLNEKQLRKLKSQQDKITRSKFLKQQQDLTKKLTEANKQLATAQNESARSKAQGQIDDIRKQLSELDYLKTAYEGATSAYQKWLDAQSAGERGDIYDNITKTAVSRADELYKAGLVGTNEFRALAELISGQDLSTASVDQVISAYKELDTAIDGTNMTLRNFFSEGQEGCNSFAKALVDLGEASLEDGAIVFDDLDTEELAKKMHTSVDMIEAILEKMNDYGAELTWMTREQADSIKEMSDRAVEAKKNWDKASKGRDDYSSDFNAEELFDLSKVRSVSDLEQKISAIKNILADPATVNMDDSQVAALRELLQICLDLKGELEAPGTSGTLTVDQFKQYEAALSKLKEDIETINKHDGLVVLSDDDREFIDLLLANKNIQKELGLEPTDDAEALMKQLGLDGSSSGLKVELGAARIKPQKTVNRTQENVERRESKITSNEVHNTTTDVHNKEEHTKITVEANADPNVYKVQTILGEFEGTPEEIAKRILVEALGEEEVLALQKAEDGVYDRKVQVIAKAIGTNDVNLLKNSINQVTGRTVGVGINVTGLSQIDTAVRKLQELANTGVRVASKTINIRTAQANGTAHAQGTAFAKGHGNWGLKRDENALINEVGPELVVRGSNWFIPNNGRPTIGYPLKKDDIIFNSKQTEELLKNGYIQHGYAKMARAQGTVGGPAHASVSGRWKYYDTKFTTAKTKSSTTKTSSSGNGGNSTSAKSEIEKEIKDWIEVLLSRVARLFDNFKDMGDYWVTYANQIKELNSAIDQAKKNITYNQQAYWRYMQEANDVGLAESYAKKVRNGTIDIEMISNENLKEQIQQYTEWYYNMPIILVIMNFI